MTLIAILNLSQDRIVKRLKQCKKVSSCSRGCLEWKELNAFELTSSLVLLPAMAVKVVDFPYSWMYSWEKLYCPIIFYHEKVLEFKMNNFDTLKYVNFT